MKRKANFDVLFAEEKKKKNKKFGFTGSVIQQYHRCSAAVQMAGKKHTKLKEHPRQTAMNIYMYIYICICTCACKHKQERL